MSLCLANDAPLTLLLFLLYMSLCSSASTSLCTIFFIFPLACLSFLSPIHSSAQFIMTTFLFQLSLSCASLVFVFAVLVHHVEKDLFWVRNYVQWIINNNSSNTTEWEEAIERERDTSCILQPNELPLYSILRHHSYTADVKICAKKQAT